MVGGPSGSWCLGQRHVIRCQVHRSVSCLRMIRQKLQLSSHTKTSWWWSSDYINLSRWNICPTSFSSSCGLVRPSSPFNYKNTAANTGHIRLRHDASIRNALSSHPSAIYCESGLVLIRFKGFFSPLLACLLRCSLIANLFECLFSAMLGSMCYITASFFPAGSICFTKKWAVNHCSNFAPSLLCHWIICQRFLSHLEWET